MPNEQPLGGWTEPRRNNFVIEALRQSDGVHALIGETLPISLLPTFIHESTHHWCFLSPVATLASLLRLRSEIEIWYHASSADAPHRAIHDRVLSEAIAEAYRPLAEGIALFAENDLRLGPNAHDTAPLNWTNAHFLKASDLVERVQPGFGDISDELYAEFRNRVNAMLDDVRISEAQREAKRRLALQPLKSSARGYLPGYLLVKRAFNALGRAAPDLAEPTLFLEWIKEFIFHDAHLVCQLLDQRSQDGVDLVFRRVNERTAALDSPRARELLRRYATLHATVARNISFGRWKPTIVDGLDLDPNEVERVDNLLIHWPRRETFDREAQDQVDAQLAFRQYVSLGSLDGVVHRFSPGVPGADAPDDVRNVLAQACIFTPDPGMELPTGRRIVVPNCNLEQPVAAARMDVLFWSTADRIMVAIYAGPQLVASVLKGDGLQPSAFEVTRAYLESRIELEEIGGRLRDNADLILNHHFPNFAHALAVQLGERTDAYVRDRVFTRLAPHERPLAFDCLRDRGLFSLFETEQQLRDFTDVSVAAACSHQGDVQPPDEMLAWSQRHEQVLGFPLIESASDRFVTAL